MNCSHMTNRNLLLKLGILFVFFLGYNDRCLTPARADGERDTIIEMELECFSHKLEEKGEIGWQDVCYSWQAPEVQEDKSREEIINDALNAFEVQTPSAPMPTISGGSTLRKPPVSPPNT